MQFLLAMAILFPLYLYTTSTSIPQQEQNIQNIVLYDGMCNLCSTWVDFISSIDKYSVINFKALQSDEGKSISTFIGRDVHDLNTIVYIRNLDQIYTKSDVTIEVLNDLQGMYRLLGSALKIFPLGLRDVVYDIVATNRYSLFGKRSECRCSAAGDEL